MAFNNNNQKDYQRGTPAQQQQRPPNRQLRQRDYNRMYQFNQGRAGPSWAQQSEPAFEHNRAMERLQTQQQQPRPVNKNNKGINKNDDHGPEPTPTTVEQDRRDELMYESEYLVNSEYPVL